MSASVAGDAGGIASRARRVIPGGVNSGQRCVPGSEGLVVASTSGATFTDTHGKVYVDFHGAFGGPILGHNDPDVDRAAASMMLRLDNAGVGVTEVEVELAERIVKHFPSIEQVLLTSSGSEATYHAIRLSRAATGRTLLVKFQGCYHGWHDSVALNVISPAGSLGTKDPLSEGSLRAVIDSTLVIPFNDVSALELVFERMGESIAAVILEPIPHNIGAILPEPEFLPRLRELCTEHGAILIFDEIITGFRHSLGGYQSISGVFPDLTTLGKAMANGYPIGAVGGRADLMERFSTIPGRPVFFAGTYNGHPAMAAAALATVRKLETEPVHEHVFALGERLRAGLRSLYRRLGVPVVVAGFGSVTVTYFTDRPVRRYEDLVHHDADLFVEYRRELVRRGYFELPLNLKRNNLSYAHREDDIAGLLEATEEAVRVVLGRRVPTGCGHP